MELAEDTGNVKINFNEKCTDIDLKSGETVFENYQSGKETKVNSDLMFGTDGAFSAVRSAMQKTDRFSYSQEYIEHGYKELTIPPNADGTFKMEREALHIWPRGNYMLIALPNPDGSFTCTLFFPFEGDPSFSELDSVNKAREFFDQEFKDALDLMPDFDKEWEENPTSSLVIIRCYPWVKSNKITILGDASHAIVPFYGQGMNSGFEDCTVFNELMTEHGEDWDTILDKFQKSRKPDADAIADLAMRNFVEMRDLTGDPKFLLQKKIEAKFSTKHPDKWIPLYSMVTFSHIRYSEALKEGKRQDRIMEKVMGLANIEEKWDSQEVEDLMLSLI
jgi:kynurenine 3-monooxygenase